MRADPPDLPQRHLTSGMDGEAHSACHSNLRVRQDRSQPTRSSAILITCPTPMHMAESDRILSVRASCSAAVPVIHAPDMPKRLTGRNVPTVGIYARVIVRDTKLA